MPQFSWPPPHRSRTVRPSESRRSLTQRHQRPNQPPRAVQSKSVHQSTRCPDDCLRIRSIPKAPERRGTSSPETLMSDPELDGRYDGHDEESDGHDHSQHTDYSLISVFFSGYVISRSCHGLLARQLLTESGSRNFRSRLRSKFKSMLPSQRSYSRSGPPLDVKHQLVFPVHLRPSGCV